MRTLLRILFRTVPLRHRPMFAGVLVAFIAAAVIGIMSIMGVR